MEAIQHGTVDNEVKLFILADPQGIPEESVDHNWPGLTLWYRRKGGNVVTFAPASLAFTNSAHADGGIIHLRGGLYRVDAPDAAFAAGSPSVEFGGEGVGIRVIGCHVPLVTYNPLDARLGMVGIPLTAPGVEGGLAGHITVAGTATLVTNLVAAIEAYFGDSGDLRGIIEAIVERTANLPDEPAAVGSAMTIDLTQALDETATAATVGAALNAARAQGFGRWAISEDGLTLTIYRSDDTTPVIAFTLPTAKNPKSRTPQ